MNSNPIPNPAEKARMVAQLQATLRLLEALPENRSCHGCGAFDAGICQNFNAEVPAEFQAKGCDQWFEPIPF